MKKLLTVGIPVYNEEKYLAQTIQCLLEQKFENWIAVIADNCSSDASYKIAKYYSTLDERIILHRHLKKKPALENFKFTLEQAKTDYFVWLSGHDLFDKNYFQEAVQELEKNMDFVMVYPKAVLVDSKNDVLDTIALDLDTVGLSTSERMANVARNLCFCAEIHGVFRRKILLEAPFKKVIGSDHLILFSVASYGWFRELPFAGIKMRKVRDETFEEAKKRWEREGLFRIRKNCNPHALLAIEHLKVVLQSKVMSAPQKISLLRELRGIFYSRFGVNTRDILSTVFTV